VSEVIDKHIARHGTTDDGYLFQGRRHKHVTRRTYQEDIQSHPLAGPSPGSPARV
jgi:hypothetical protein